MTHDIPGCGLRDRAQLDADFARVRTFADELGVTYETEQLADGRPSFRVTRPPLKLLQLMLSIDLQSGEVVWRGWGVLSALGLEPATLLEVANDHNVTRSDSVLVALPDGFGCRRSVSIRVVGHVRSLLDGMVADLEEAAAAAKVSSATR